VFSSIFVHFEFGIIDLCQELSLRVQPTYIPVLFGAVFAIFLPDPTEEFGYEIEPHGCYIRKKKHANSVFPRPESTKTKHTPKWLVHLFVIEVILGVNVCFQYFLAFWVWNYRFVPGAFSSAPAYLYPGLIGAVFLIVLPDPTDEFVYEIESSRCYRRKTASSRSSPEGSRTSVPIFIGQNMSTKNIPTDHNFVHLLQQIQGNCGLVLIIRVTGSGKRKIRLQSLVPLIRPMVWRSFYSPTGFT